MRNKHLIRLVAVALLAAIAIVLTFFEFNLPFFPSFLKLDFSSLPALIATLAFGPVAGIATELVKNLVDFLKASSGGVGQLANLIMGTAFILPIGLICRKSKSLGRLLAGFAVGTVVMSAAGAVTNYYILIPFYVSFLNIPLEGIIASASKIIPAIDSLFTVVLFGVVPFNLFKGTLLSAIAIPVYKRLGKGLDTLTVTK
ncbi:ECF transporter S component [Oscillospiraceae bacterium OttesenSCG-928-F05]|nr:ECF transporter S component [Oscillospiraceae bacterium OttesenSCG-928-F05]